MSRCIISHKFSFRIRLRAVLAACGMSLALSSSLSAAITTTGNVTPDPSTTTSSSMLYVGNTADGTMQVNGGSIVTTGTSNVGYTAAATGNATVSDPNSKWTATFFTIGYQGHGFVTIANGATSTASFLTLGERAGGYGSLSVTGAGSTVTASSIDVGDDGDGVLNITSGGKVTGTFVDIGGFFGGVGDATVSGSGSSLVSTASLSLGTGGPGQLHVENGASVSSSSASIGDYSGTTGTATVTGGNSKWTTTSELSIGYLGAGTLNIAQGATVNVGTDTFSGRTSSVAGTLNLDNGTLVTGGLGTGFNDLRGTGTISTHGLVSDINLVFDNANGFQQQFVLNSEPGQNITINLDASSAGSTGAGWRSQGTLRVADGRQLQSRNGYLGYHPGSTGTATIEGAGSSWTTTGDMTVGNYGAGTLAIKSGGVVSVGASTIVGVTSANSAINFDNATLNTKSLFAAPSDLTGNGTINTRGVVSDINLVFDQAHPLQQQITLTGANQNVAINLNADGGGAIGAGYRGQGTLSISGGVNVPSALGYLGYRSGSTGTATVSGAGSTWSINSQLNIGGIGGGVGNLAVSNGATVADNDGSLSRGTVTVTGNGSTWANRNTISIGGFAGTAELLVTGGGKVTSTSTAFGSPTGGIAIESNSTGKATIDGPGSNWTHTGSLIVGRDGAATLNITGGGALVSGGAVLGNGSFSGSGTATVSGAGSSWTNTAGLTVGTARPGTLTISGGGSVSSTTGSIAANFSAPSSVVTVSDIGSAWTMSGGLAVGGSFLTPTFPVSGGTGTLTINPGATVQVASDNTTIFSQGRINLQGGTLTAKEIRFQGIGGVFNWTGGTLHVGTYNGSLTNSAGILAPGQSPGKTGIAGAYTQQSGATLQIEIGGATVTTQYDWLSVTGNATLGGTLQLSLINSFLPSQSDVFTILSAGGNLTGTFSNAPSGQRVTTSDGAGSFLVYYGAGSIYNPRNVVLTGFLAAVPEPATVGLIGAYLFVALLSRRRTN
jgi:T5SS/PEP-CTERM-associated repeat protein